MAKKGISPVIAVVMLIAVAIAIAGMVSSWASRIVLQGATDNPCAGITTLYALTEPSFSASTGDLKVKLKNLGRDEVYNFTVQIDNGTAIHMKSADFPAATYHIKPGLSQYIIVNVNSTNSTGVSTMTVMAESCPGYTPAPINV